MNPNYYHMENPTELQKRACEVLPQTRNAFRQLFVQNAPEDALQFFVEQCESDNPDAKELVASFLPHKYFGMYNPFRSDEANAEAVLRDRYYFDGLIDTFDLLLRVMPILDRMSVDHLFGHACWIKEFGVKRGLPVDRHHLRSSFITQVLTQKHRVTMTDWYRDFIRENREAIELNLDVIVARGIYQPRDIKSVIYGSSALANGVL